MPLRTGGAPVVAVDAGVVDDGVQPAELVDLIGKLRVCSWLARLPTTTAALRRVRSLSAAP